MKLAKSIRTLISCCILLFTVSCQQDDVLEPVVENNHEVSFKLNIGDLAKSGEIGVCMEPTELENLANAGNLKIRATIAKGVSSAALAGMTEQEILNISEDFEKTVRVANGDLVADGIALAIGTHALTMFTVWDCSDPQGEVLLFSAIGEDSPEFAPFVPDGYLLPLDVVIDPADKFTKRIKDIFIICVEDHSPVDFGFKQWNLHFMKIVCIPFVVKECPEGGTPNIAEGELRIYQDADHTDNVYTKGKLVRTITFDENNMGKLCFADNWQIDDDKEFYGFELFTVYEGAFNELPVTGEANVTTLKDFVNSNAWDAVEEVLDIDLCGCNSWFFDCQEYVLGTYCFEDLWPGEGDYDFNDLIVEYRNSFIYDDPSATQIREIQIDYDLIAMGAGYQNNMFAIRFEGLNLSGVNYRIERYCDERADPNVPNYQPYLLEQTGVWNIGTQSDVFEVTDRNVVILPILDKVQNRFRLTTNPGGNPNQINVWESLSRFQGLGYKYRIVIYFDTPVPAGIEIFPLMIVRANKRVEINVPYQEPSSRTAFRYYRQQKTWWNNADHIFFATYPYESGQNVRPYKPWVLDIPYLDIRYAKEGKRVTNLYDPEFSNWAKSKYTQYLDWFNKTIPQPVLDEFWFNPDFANP